MTSRAPPPAPERRRVRVGRPVVPLVIAMAAAALFACWVAGSIMTRGGASPVQAARSPATDFRLRSRDGIALAATFRPGRSDRSPGVLLLHGVGASRAATAANAA